MQQTRMFNNWHYHLQQLYITWCFSSVLLQDTIHIYLKKCFLKKKFGWWVNFLKHNHYNFCYYLLLKYWENHYILQECLFRKNKSAQSYYLLIIKIRWSCQLHRILRLSYSRDCTRVCHVTSPAKFDAAGRKSHATDCDVTDIVRILPTLKILSRKVFENHLYAYAVVAVQDDFSVLLDWFHD